MPKLPDTGFSEMSRNRKKRFNCFGESYFRNFAITVPPHPRMAFSLWEKWTLIHKRTSPSPRTNGKFGS